MVEDAKTDVLVNAKDKPCSIFADTQGGFELIVDGKKTHFSRKKSKQALEYLICLNGEGIKRRQMASVLWHDDCYDALRKDYVNHVLADLKKDLSKVGAGHILRRNHGFYSVDMDSIACSA